MILILGTSRDIDKIYDYPEQLKRDISGVLSILDTSYGSTRDVMGDLGGAVVIVDTAEYIKTIYDLWNLDILNDIYEYEERMCGYIKRVFILSADYGIAAYIREELL